MVAAAGKVRSGVVVATMIRSTSAGVRPAAASARRAASTARSDVASPSRASMALADAGALDDPRVAGVDDLGQVVVGHDPSGR